MINFSNVGPYLWAVVGLSCVGGANANGGKAVYAQYCEACHGVDGDGRGPAAVLLKTRPRDFTKSVFEFRSTPSGHLPTESDLIRTIERGVPGTAMPSWKNLPDRKIQSVALYLKTFSQRWDLDTPSTPIAIPAVPSRLDSTDSVARGAEVYVRAGCWECHGGPGPQTSSHLTNGRGTAADEIPPRPPFEKGEYGGIYEVRSSQPFEYPWGQGPKSGELVDDHREPIHAVDIRLAKFQGGESPQDLYRTLVTGMDGTPMPSYVDSLTPDETWALISYIRALRSRGEG